MAKAQELGPHREFGEWLRTQREKTKSLSQLHGATVSRDRGLGKIKQGKLSYLERGWNGNPDPQLLREVAALYSVSYAEVVARWVAHRFGLAAVCGFDLLRHTAEIYIAPLQGGVDDAAAARIRELEAQVKERDAKVEDRDARLAAAEDVANRLLRILAADDEDRAARKPKRPGGGGGRKAG